MSFSFKNLGHYIAVAARDIVKFGKTVAPGLEVAVETATAIVAPNVPDAVAVERAAFAAFGHVTQAVQDIATTGTDPNAQVTVTLTMLQSEVADFKQLAADFTAIKNHQGVKIGQ